MEVKKGYKQTEVGIIPDDWKCVTAQSCCNKITDGTHDTPKPVADGTPFLTAIHIGDGKLDFDNCLYLSEQDHRSIYQRCNPEYGDVLMVNIGAGIATTALVKEKFEFSLKNVALIKPNRKVVQGDYLDACIRFNKQAIIRTVSSGGAQPFISLTQINQIWIPLPPTMAEQEAIAGALSDADAWIESLEQLIAKKRQIKQGAMQELLTGKRRLPGFSGKWETKRLGELLSFQVGFPFISSRFNESSIGLRLIRNRDLKSDIQVFYYNGPYDDAFIVRDGDVLIGMDGDFVTCWWDRGESLLNQRVGRVVPRRGLNLSFAYYALIKPLKHIESVTASTTVKHLSHGDVEGLDMAIPDLNEQTALATVFSDMDTEIESLESKLAKAREIKQGMMQELLTGRIRLI